MILLLDVDADDGFDVGGIIDNRHIYDDVVYNSNYNDDVSDDCVVVDDRHHYNDY